MTDPANEDPGSVEPSPIYKHFRVWLRIYGDEVPLDQLTRTLGLQPSDQHRKGDRRSPGATPWEHDMWSYRPPVDQVRPPSEHISALWDAIRPNIEYLRSLRPRLTVNVFCGYRSNCDHAGFEVEPRCLGLFQELDTPFDVSVIVVFDD